MARFLVPKLNLGEIPFSCKVNYDLPENVKIACKARLISRTLGDTNLKNWFSYQNFALFGPAARLFIFKFKKFLTNKIYAYHIECKPGNNCIVCIKQLYCMY